MINRLISTGCKLILLTAAIGCASIPLNNETFFYSYSKKTMRNNIPEVILKECGYQLTLKKPTVYGVDYSNSDVVRGTFHPRDNSIRYENGNYLTLVHEYQHFLNHNTTRGMATWDCLDQITAYYASRIVYLERKLKK